MGWMSFTNSGYFAVIYLCLLRGERETQQKARAPGLNRPREKNLHAGGEGGGDLSPLMISIISTGALPVNSRGPRLHLTKEKKQEGGGGGRPKGAGWVGGAPKVLGGWGVPQRCWA